MNGSTQKVGERVTEIVDCFATQTNVFYTILHTIIFKLYALAEIARTFSLGVKRQTLFVVLHRRLFADRHVHECEYVEYFTGFAN